MSQQRQHVRKSLVGAGFSLVDLSAGIALTLVLSPYVVRSLGDRLYAILVLAGTFTGWFALLDLGLSAAVSRFVTLHFAQGDWTKLNRIGNTAFFLYTGLGAAGFAASLIVGAVALIGRPDMPDVATFAWVVGLFGLAFMVMLPTQAFAGVVSGAMRPEVSTARTLAFRLLTAAATFAVLYFGQNRQFLGFDGQYHRLSSPALLIGIAASGTLLKIVNAWVFWRTTRATVPSFELSPRFFARSEAGSLFGYSLIAFLSQVGDVILFRVDALIVASVVGVSAVTHYQLGAAGFLEQYTGVMVAATGWMTGVLTLLFARGEENAIREGMKLAYRGSVYVSTFIAFGLVAWTPDFVSRWIGAEYLDAYPALLALVAYYWWTSCQTPSLRYVYAVAKHGLFAACQLGEGACHLVLGVVLGARFGLLGVALGTLIPGWIGRGFLLQVVVCRVRGVSVVGHYAGLCAHIVRAGVALLLPYFVAPGITAFLLDAAYRCLGRAAPIGPNYPQLVVNGILSAIFYCGVLAWIGFRADQRRVLMDLLFRKRAAVENDAGSAPERQEALFLSTFLSTATPSDDPLAPLVPSAPR